MYQREYKMQLDREQLTGLNSEYLMIPLDPVHIVAAHRVGLKEDSFYKIDENKVRQLCCNDESIANIYSMVMCEYYRDCSEYILYQVHVIEYFGIKPAEALYFYDKEIRALVHDIADTPLKYLYKYLLTEKNRVILELRKRETLREKITAEQERKDKIRTRAQVRATRLQNTKIKTVTKPTMEAELKKQAILYQTIDCYYNKVDENIRIAQATRMYYFALKNRRYEERCRKIQEYFDRANEQQYYQNAMYYEQYSSPKKIDQAIHYPRQLARSSPRPASQFKAMVAMRQQSQRVRCHEAMLYNELRKEYLMEQLYKQEDEVLRRKYEMLERRRYTDDRISYVYYRRLELIETERKEREQKQLEKVLSTQRVINSILQDRYETRDAIRLRNIEKEKRHWQMRYLEQYQWDQKMYQYLESTYPRTDQNLAKINKLLEKTDYLRSMVKHGNLRPREEYGCYEYIVALLNEACRLY